MKLPSLRRLLPVSSASPLSVLPSGSFLGLLLGALLSGCAATKDKDIPRRHTAATVAPSWSISK